MTLSQIVRLWLSVVNFRESASVKHTFLEKLSDNDLLLIRVPVEEPVYPWMFNNCLKASGRKLNVLCAWRQSKIPRLCHVYTHSVWYASTNTLTTQEDSFRQQSNVQFVRLAFKSLKKTHLAAYPRLFISTDWWISSL